MKISYLDTQYVTILPDDDGVRVDNFLHRYLKGVPMSRIYCLLRKGNIKVNNKKVIVQYKLQTNDQLYIPPLYAVMNNVIKDPVNIRTITQLNFPIIYEDDYMLAINKPSGFAVHSGTRLNYGIIEYLRLISYTSQFLELVHRLDKCTSGVLLFAKKRRILKYLHEQFRSKIIYKEYTLLVHGQWNSSIKMVNAPLLNNIASSYSHIVHVDKIYGKSSLTIFIVRKYFDCVTLMTAIPITGRKHQIRVHASYVGHPIVFDELYGNKSYDEYFKEYNINRLFLHASILKFSHPYDNKNISINAPLDKDLISFLYLLHSNK